MTFEVELKFAIPDPADITLQLIARGATPGPVVEHYDLYLRHPARDFRQTHEALRLRRAGDKLFITYKGPVVDSKTKTRREIEIPFGEKPADFDRLVDLFRLLGFHPVRPVEKTRAIFHLAWQGRELELAVDTVEGLGSFLEIEALANDEDRDAARDVVLQLAERLGLKHPERRSYLNLVMEQDERRNSAGQTAG